jgi:DNA helicase HerA-like ATPase
MPYMRLRARLESLQSDHRFRFMFSEPYDAPDTLSEVIGRLLRIPVQGKPMTIIDLSGLPSEIADVIVSLCCRVLFDFASWSDRRRMPPVLLVCEEAHRYVPSDPTLGFAAAARAVTRISKEGRKYGLSLALVSQRPSELSAEALSQCGTVFSLHLGNEPDQRFMARTLPDAARGMLANLSSLPVQQAIVTGEGVPLPVRIRFDNLPPERRPHSASAAFSKAWQHDDTDEAFRDDGVFRWRTHNRYAHTPA